MIDAEVIPFTRRARHKEPAKAVVRHYPARVARTLALAHALDARLRSGEFKGHADMARALGFTRARITQLMDLLLLAPDIQARVLALRTKRAEGIQERDLRRMAAHLLWAEQRSLWTEPIEPTCVAGPASAAGTRILAPRLAAK